MYIYIYIYIYICIYIFQTWKINLKISGGQNGVWSEFHDGDRKTLAGTVTGDVAPGILRTSGLK
jgi:hypothetical protein